MIEKVIKIVNSPKTVKLWIIIVILSLFLGLSIYLLIRNHQIKEYADDKVIKNEQLEKELKNSKLLYDLRQKRIDELEKEKDELRKAFEKEIDKFYKKYLNESKKDEEKRKDTENLLDELDLLLNKYELDKHKNRILSYRERS